jgi:hypothetical protein
MPVGTPLSGAPLTVPSGNDAFSAAVHLRDVARAQMLRHCGEPGL